MSGVDDQQWNLYVDAFRRVLDAMPSPDLIDSPGILGRPGTPDRPNGRLLVVDDAAHAWLADIARLHAGMIIALPEAARCVEALHASGLFEHQEGTAMVLRDLAGIADAPLADGLLIRRATVEPTAGEVPLEHAAAASLIFDPVEGDLTPSSFAAYLASIPNATLLAATDAEGSVRATAGTAVFGEDARVFFVSTDQALRGRGIGTAMTAAALRAAAAGGAVRACLEGSAAGRSIYLRLGFEAVRPVELFSDLG